MISRQQIFKIIFFLLALALADQVTGYVLRKLYFTQKSGQQASLDYSLNKCNADILIFGNSRAQHHYDPRILQDSLHLSCYNAGMDGGHSLLMQYAQIKVITARYTPKIIILEFLPDNIGSLDNVYEKLSILLPYYKEYPYLQSLILLRGPFEKVKLISSVYPFNSDLLNIVRYNTNTQSARKKDIEGYVPLKEVMSLEMTEAKPDPMKNSIVDTNMVSSLKNIIRICKEKNISLYIISSPFFQNENEKINPVSIPAKLAIEILRQNNIDYLDLSGDASFIHKRVWFTDKGHLNKIGASRFSSIIVHWIKKQESQN